MSNKSYYTNINEKNADRILQNTNEKDADRMHKLIKNISIKNNLVKEIVIKILLIGIFLFALIITYPCSKIYAAEVKTDTNNTYSTIKLSVSGGSSADTASKNQVNDYVKEEVKIGLFFKDQSRNLNTEIAYFDIFAEKGLNIGYDDGKKFTTLISINDNTVITIRKDSYFINENNTLIEYNADADIKKTADGNKIGPFHIKIGDNYSDYNNARSEAMKIKEKGINAYPVYSEGSWCIWSGFYPNEKSAMEDIDKTISKKLESVGKNRENIVIYPNSNNIVVTSGPDEVLAIFSSNEGSFRIQPDSKNDPYIFNINGKNYRGIIEVKRLEHSDMTVINILPVEHYLYGVVPCEIGWESHIEALKAQAVASRTYTYNNFGKYSTLGFDLCSTVNSQVYKGFDFEKEETNKAVDDTKGKVIYYNDDIAQVFYFSSSGGMTEAAKNVWSSDIPYLQSVEDKYESGNSYNYNWERTLTAANINNIITSRGNEIGDILRINITKTSEVGRAIEVVIEGSKGDVVLEKARSRDVLGLPSQWYDIITNADILVWDNSEKSTVRIQPSGKKVITGEGIKTMSVNTKIHLISAEETMTEFTGTPNNYTFKGKGYGHAVGMSQEGAKGMANAGFSYEEILSHYFVGTYVK